MCVFVFFAVKSNSCRNKFQFCEITLWSNCLRSEQVPSESAILNYRGSAPFLLAVGCQATVRRALVATIRWIGPNLKASNWISKIIILVIFFNKTKKKNHVEIVKMSHLFRVAIFFIWTLRIFFCICSLHKSYSWENTQLSLFANNYPNWNVFGYKVHKTELNWRQFLKFNIQAKKEPTYKLQNWK